MKRLALLLGLLLSIGSAGAFPPHGGGTPTPPPAFPTATPFMGWNSWYQFAETITQSTMQTMSDYLVTSGLTAAGYSIVWQDEGWTTAARNGSGNLVPTASYPDMKAMADHIKANGQYPFIYTEAGPLQCDNVGQGSYGHYTQDATQFFVTWGYQGLKLDGCSLAANSLDPKVQGTAMESSIVSVAGSNISLSMDMGTGGQFTPEWEFGPYTASAWSLTGNYDPGGVGGCTTDFNGGVSKVFWLYVYHPGSHGPYHFNHVFYMMVHSASLTADEMVTQVAMYAETAQPLIIGCDPRTFTTDEMALVKNSELIALDQDSWVNGAIFVDFANGGGGYGTANTYEVYGRWLSGVGHRAIAIVSKNNLGLPVQSVTFDPAKLGITGTYTLRDVLTHTDLCSGTCTGTITVTGLASHATRLLVLSGGTEVPTTCLATNPGGSSAASSGAPGSCAFIADNNGWTACGVASCPGSPPTSGAGGLPLDGTTASVGNTIDRSAVTNPAPQSVYQSARIGTQMTGTIGEGPIEYFANNLTVGATYLVRLHFSENWKTGAGQRQFNVRLNNGVTQTQVLTNEDVFAETGAQFKALVKEYTITAPHGVVSVDFSSGAVDYPMIAGVEWIKQ